MAAGALTRSPCVSHAEGALSRRRTRLVEEPVLQGQQPVGLLLACRGRGLGGPDSTRALTVAVNRFQHFGAAFHGPGSLQGLTCPSGESLLLCHHQQHHHHHHHHHHPPAAQTMGQGAEVPLRLRRQKVVEASSRPFDTEA